MDVSGIDLGSVNSVVVFSKEIVSRSKRTRFNHQVYGIPSILFSNENQVFVGEEARYLAEDRPDLKVVFEKRVLDINHLQEGKEGGDIFLGPAEVAFHILNMQ